jgi:hypothetical protein
MIERHTPDLPNEPTDFHVNLKDFERALKIEPM